MANLRQVFRLVTPYFVHIPIYGSIWGFACASDTLDPRRRAARGDRPAHRRARRSASCSTTTATSTRAVFALPNYVRKLVA